MSARQARVRFVRADEADVAGDFNAGGACDDAGFQVFNLSYEPMLCNERGALGRWLVRV